VLAGLLAGLLLIATVAPYAPVRTEATDPAARISDFYLALLATLKRAKRLGPKGRYEKLAAIVPKTFDIAGMIRVAAGVAWERATIQQQAALADTASRMIAANYAGRFDIFNRAKFEVLPAVAQSPSDRLVKTLLIENESKIIALYYLMHNTSNGLQWLEGR
jgi:phospholipid transport system substrate-binding protein